MKLLENSNLDRLNSVLFTKNDDCRIIGRIESYSCKMAGDDKRLFKVFSHDAPPTDLAALAPPQTILSASPNAGNYSRSLSSADENDNPLSHVCSRKTLYYLISTLNASFRPDYDFSHSKSDEFSREPSVTWVQSFIDNTLGTVLGEHYHRLHSTLWNTVDEEIDLKECNVYSYNPDLECDPFGDEGCLWSFNFFLYNLKKKRIVFFTCKAQSASADDDSGLGRDNLDMSDEEMEYFLGIEEEENSMPIVVE
ncbi:repressor of RNA polymerase III transcription MAF1 homolog [Styela clava]